MKDKEAQRIADLLNEQRNEENPFKNLEKYMKYIFIGGIILLILLNSFYTIQAGQRGVILTMGKPSMNASSEGFHFKIPLIQTVKKMEVRTIKIETSADSITKDLQGVMTVIALNYHLNHESVPKLYQEIGLDYQNRIINPAIQESVKAVMAKYEIEELTDKRPEVSKEIKEFLTKRLSKYYIVVDDFNVVNFDWSEKFKSAIEDKLTAEQKKLTAERDLERIKIEKEQKITQAQAEAESIRIQSLALKENKDILELRAIEKWDGVMPKVTGGVTPFFDSTSLIE